MNSTETANEWYWYYSINMVTYLILNVIYIILGILGIECDGFLKNSSQKHFNFLFIY
jgi:hypothetical protein